MTDRQTDSQSDWSQGDDTKGKQEERNTGEQVGHISWSQGCKKDQKPKSTEAQKQNKDVKYTDRDNSIQF